MDERRRSPARLLAPAALVAVAVALAFVLSTSSAPPDSSSTDRRGEDIDLVGEDSAEATEADGSSSSRGSREERLPEGCYVVKAGDTLAGIGEKTGLQVERLQELNPEADAQALVTGQQLDLREGGCD